MAQEEVHGQVTMSDGARKDDAQPEPGPHGFLTSLAVMIAMCVAVELFYRDSRVDLSLRKGSNHVTAKALEYEKVGGDIVVTGDSRIFHGINPTVMNASLQELKGKTYSTYNFGIPSATLPITLMVAHEAARHQPAPRVVVLGVSPTAFSCCDSVGASGVQPGMRWSAVPSFVSAAWYTSPEDAGSSVSYGASRLLAFRTELSAAVHDFVLPQPFTFQDHGYNSFGNRVAPAQQDIRARGRAGPYAELMDKSKGAYLHPLPGKLLDEAISILERAGVRVAVVATPQARQLDWYLDETHTYFEYLAEVKRITSKHGVPFFDMHAPPGIENTDFVDGDHLSEPGATAFTKLVAAEVVAPLVP
ncbi:MAG: hypothetical protein JWP87_1331 [Labilithrix sp.]|nr:hypothetical protein [Labilithrix sp.]